MTTLLVVAKEPRAGRSKTRLCPPCTPAEAAWLAEAALADTLSAVAATPGVRRVLVLDGRPGPWMSPGVEVVAQGGGGLDDRLAQAFAGAGGPALLVGMDTPQVTPGLLTDALANLARPEVDAVLGPAVDGGWWALGLTDPHPADILGVPMSTPHTGMAQLVRLAARGRRVQLLPRLRDVDRIDDARAVAALAPRSRFAARLRALTRLEGGSGPEPMRLQA
ncbi:MAG: TIGR04282 family arsenosugar biosynthesis glycosyltransferase [Acidimicrobiia bacterium]